MKPDHILPGQTAGTIPCVRIGKRSVRYLLSHIVSQLRRRKEGGRK